MWSFGVVLWELFSNAKNPYPYIFNQELLEELKKGVRMDFSAETPSHLTELISNCWKAVPEDRPAFKEIASNFRTHLKISKELACVDIDLLLNPRHSFYEELGERDSHLFDK